MITQQLSSRKSSVACTSLCVHAVNVQTDLLMISADI